MVAAQARLHLLPQADLEQELAHPGHEMAKGVALGPGLEILPKSLLHLDAR